MPAFDELNKVLMISSLNVFNQWLAMLLKRQYAACSLRRLETA